MFRHCEPLGDLMKVFCTLWKGHGLCLRIHLADRICLRLCPNQSPAPEDLIVSWIHELRLWNQHFTSFSRPGDNPSGIYSMGPFPCTLTLFLFFFFCCMSIQPCKDLIPELQQTRQLATYAWSCGRRFRLRHPPLKVHMCFFLFVFSVLNLEFQCRDSYRQQHFDRTSWILIVWLAVPEARLGLVYTTKSTK